MAVAVAKRRRVGGGLGSERTREALVGYGFVALPMAFFLLFFIFPIGYAFYISRYDWQIFKGPFVGWDNYRTLYHDSVFWSHAVRNTLVYTVSVVPLQIALGLTLAVVVNQAIRFRTFFRAAFYFPSLAASAAVAAIATYILASDGLFNTILDHLGYHHNNAWFAQESTALPAIIGLNAWTTSGTIMIFYLAALQAIPIDVYEAAAIDGAGAWRTFRKITFPLLKPAHFFVAVVSIIGALQMFDQSFLIGGASGGPNYSTLTVVLYLYNQAIAQHQVRVWRGGRRRPLRFHLHGDRDPATPLREGRGQPDEHRRTAAGPAGRCGRAAARGTGPRDRRRQRAFRAASGSSGSARSIVYLRSCSSVGACSSRFRSSGACRRRSERSPTPSPDSRCFRVTGPRAATTRRSTPLTSAITRSTARSSPARSRSRTSSWLRSGAMHLPG